MSDKSHRNVGGGAHYDACPRWKERDCEFEDGECVCDDFDGIICAAVAAARRENAYLPTVKAEFERGYSQGERDGVKAAREAIPDNDHRTDLDINDYDTATEYGLAIAKAAIDGLEKP